MFASAWKSLKISIFGDTTTSNKTVNEPTSSNPSSIHSNVDDNPPLERKRNTIESENDNDHEFLSKRSRIYKAESTQNEKQDDPNSTLSGRTVKHKQKKVSVDGDMVVTKPVVESKAGKMVESEAINEKTVASGATNETMVVSKVTYEKMMLSEAIYEKIVKSKATNKKKEKQIKEGCNIIRSRRDGIIKHIKEKHDPTIEMAIKGFKSWYHISTRRPEDSINFKDTEYQQQAKKPDEEPRPLLDNTQNNEEGKLVLEDITILLDELFINVKNHNWHCHYFLLEFTEEASFRYCPYMNCSKRFSATQKSVLFSHIKQQHDTNFIILTDMNCKYVFKHPTSGEVMEFCDESSQNILSDGEQIILGVLKEQKNGN
ncbi:hypothetical protein BDA99DRAFT_544410 [Phascolomyces articulosus]|uniref:Uncharacterized protein n=1 Tax=Phascolomyces articulosus TaxID=60185 RepID=A0AAD5P788_9FUNG|nr:hypothetical protein BDA99DRAFT_544410 [Phascolomyces articulosus]